MNLKLSIKLLVASVLVLVISVLTINLMGILQADVQVQQSLVASGPFSQYEKLITFGPAIGQYYEQVALSGNNLAALYVWPQEGRDKQPKSYFIEYYRFGTDNYLWPNGSSIAEIHDIELYQNETAVGSLVCTCVGTFNYVYGMGYPDQTLVRPGDGMGLSYRPDIWGNYVTYYRKISENGAMVNKIMLSDKVSHTPIDTGGNYVAGPRIYQNKIVWLENRGGSNHLMLYDINSHVKTELRGGIGTVREDDIDIDGNTVVLSDNGNLFTYNLSTNKYAQLTWGSNGSANYYVRPRMSGNIVDSSVYTSSPSTYSANATVIDISSKKQLFLTTSNSSFAIAVDGGRVAYSDMRVAGRDEIYAIENIGNLISSFGKVIVPGAVVTPIVTKAAPTGSSGSGSVSGSSGGNRTGTSNGLATISGLLPDGTISSSTTSSSGVLDGSIVLTGEFQGYSKKAVPSLKTSDKLTIKGTAQADAKINITLSPSDKKVSLVADDKGNWQATLDFKSLGLKAGEYNVQVEEICCNGAQKTLLNMGKIKLAGEKTVLSAYPTISAAVISGLVVICVIVLVAIIFPIIRKKRK